MKDQENGKTEELKESVKICPELLAEEFRDFFSSPCSMNVFEEEDVEKENKTPK